MSLSSPNAETDLETIFVNGCTFVCAEFADRKISLGTEGMTGWQKWKPSGAYAGHQQENRVQIEQRVCDHRGRNLARTFVGDGENHGEHDERK